VQKASSRTTELNEQFLRRISAELHDGPAQLLGFAALRIESVDQAGDRARRSDEVARIRSALRDLRSICLGLALPEIDRMSLAQVLESVVGAHRQRTGAPVDLQLHGDLAAAAFPKSLRICAYRFVQEGLNNAYRHAGEVEVRVYAEVMGDVLCLAVEDRGRGLADAARPREGLGLTGLRERVESLGGEFQIESPAGAGVRISMRIGLSEVQQDV
jgi:signal transduction histidine kinase